MENEEKEIKEENTAENTVSENTTPGETAGEKITEQDSVTEEKQKDESGKKKKKHRRFFTINVFIAILLCAAIVLLCFSVYAYKNREAIHEELTKTVAPVKPGDTTPVPTALPQELTTPGSKTILVNQTYALARDYVPSDLATPYLNSTTGQIQVEQEAGDKAKEMIAQASSEGVTLLVTSGYRSYDDQENLYNSMVQNLGSEDAASKVCAKAGMSEHQTGLALDFTDNANNSTETEAFGDTAAGQWLFQHAHEYGFILRYPKGKEDITGYSYMPWHYRYVGVDLANDIWNKTEDHNETFEEYYGITK